MSVPIELAPRGLYRLWRKPVSIDERGITCGAASIDWDRVAFYHCHQWKADLLETALVVVAPGASIVIDAGYRAPRLAMERIIDEIHARLATRTVCDVEPFQLDANALCHTAAGRLALCDIERVEIVGPRRPGVAVHARGWRRDPWACEDIVRVRNCLLLLEELARGGVTIRATVPFWVPSSLTALATAVVVPELPVARRI